MRLCLARSLLACVAAAALAACASTTDLRNAKALSATGKQYATAMDDIAAATLESRLDRGARDLKAIRDTDPTSKALADAFARRTDNAREFAIQVGLYRAQVRVLALYFEALDALATEDAKTPVEEAAKATAGQLSTLGTALKATGLTLNEAQQSAVGTLTGLVAERAHARAVSVALRRDAVTVGTQLALQKEAMALFIGVLDSESASRLAEATTSARAIYTATASQGKPVPLPPGWGDSWKMLAREQALLKQAQSAIATTAAMEIAWNEFLQGKATTADLLADLQSLQATANALAKFQRDDPASK